MIETHGLKFTVDAQDAVRGYTQFKGAVEGVLSSVDKFEAHVLASMKKIGDSTKRDQPGKKFAAQFKELGSIKIDTSAAGKLKMVSAAMASFKAPNATQIANLRSFYRVLGTTPTVNFGSFVKGLPAANAAMAGFKAPSAAQSKKFTDFAKAVTNAVPALVSLKKITGISGIANELATISIAMRNIKVPSGTQVNNLMGFANALRRMNFSNLSNAAGFYSFISQLSRFRAPSATQIRNLENFVTSLGNLKIPRNAAQVASAIAHITREVDRAGGSFRNLRGTMGSINFGRISSGARQAATGMRGLENAFSATYQMGSLFRSLVGAITLGEIARGFFGATDAALKFKAAVGSVLGGQVATAELSYVNDLADRMGVNLESAQIGLSKLTIAGKLSGATMAEVHQIFEGFSTAMTVQGTSAAKQGDIWLAVQQVMNKGYLASEELNQQLNEGLPGAMGIMSKATKELGMSLQDALKKKMIDGKQAMLLLATEYQKTFGPAMVSALERPAVQLERLKTKWAVFNQLVGEAGGNQAFADFLKKINEYFSGDAMQRWAKFLGGKLVEAMDRVTKAADYLYKNWDKIKGPLAFVLEWGGKFLILSGTLRIGQFLVNPVIGLGTAAYGALPHLKQLLILVRALNAASLAGLLTQMRLMNPATLMLLTPLQRVKQAFLALGNQTVWNSLKTGIRSLNPELTGFRGVALGVAGAIATGFLAAFGTASQATKRFGADGYTTAEIMAGTWDYLKEKVAGAWDAAMTAAAKVSKWWAENVNISIGDVGAFFGRFLVNFTAGFQTASKIIYLVFKGAFQWMSDRLSQISGALSSLANGDFVGAAKGFLGLKDTLWNTMANGLGGHIISEMKADFIANKSQIETGLFNFGNEAGARGRALSAKPDGPVIRPPVPGPSPSTYNPAELLGEGSGSGKKKKGKTAKQLADEAANALNRLESRADQIMKRIGEDNPVLKAQQEITNDITEQAQAFLGINTAAYNSWKDNLTANAAKGVSATDSLIAKMQEGGDATKILDDIEKRYGVTKKQVIEQMREQAVQHDRNLRIAEYELAMKKKEAEFGSLAMQNYAEEVALGSLANREREIASRTLDEVRRAAQKGIPVTADMIAGFKDSAEALYDFNKRLTEQHDFMENNGIRRYMDDMLTMGEAVNNMDNNFLKNMEDSLYRLGTEGKLSFKSLINGMQQDLMRFASQSVTGDIMSMLIPGYKEKVAAGGNPSLFGGLFGAMGMGNYQKEGYKQPNLGTDTNPMRVFVVNAPDPLNPTGSLSVIRPGSTGPVPVDAAGNPIAATGDAVANAVTNSMGTAAPNIAQNFSNVFGQAINGIGGVFSSVINSVLGMFGGAGGGGLGGIGGVLGSLFGGGKSGGGSGLGNIVSSGTLPGIFKEGGYSDRPVAWANAPHYAQGTANTSGGKPAILHDNEAVIPLSRGRKVPVHLTNSDSQSNGRAVSVNFNVTSPDADSFRRSKQQIMSDLHAAGSRTARRNR